MKKSKRAKKRGMIFEGKHQVASETLITMQTEYKDADNFVFTFDDDVPENEREYYAKQYSRIDQVRVERSHCTTCDLHIGTAPIVEKTLRTHPVLKVTHCNKCFVFYNSGEFGTGEDGSEFYCRWCGQGGEVFCCSSCPYVFCIKCIRTNLGVSFVREIEKKDDWLCFVCDKTILLRMRANHWALQNYIAKQMAIIKTIGDESKINTLLNDDNSICCPKKKRRLLTLKGSGTGANMINIKRSFPMSNATPAQPPQKKAAIADSSKQNPIIPSKSNGNNEIVCTPDILGLLDDKVLPSTAVTLQRKSATKKTNNKIPPIAPASKPVVRMIVPTTSGEQSQKGAIYHTVSGFQIDLNQAARQPIYRLPSGKLIQVRKETSNNNVQGLRPQLLTPIPRETSITVRPNASNNRHRMPFVMQPNQLRGAVRTQMRVPMPTTNQRFTISDGRVMSHISHPNNHSQTSTTSSSQVGLTANAQQNGLFDVQAQQGSTIFTQQNGTISVSRAAHPDTPFGKAKIEFEDKIISGMEICQHTINKMITLSNSTPFKSAKKFQDIKDLYIHLQYLFQYTSGKFATLQESLATSMDGLVEFDPTLKEKTEDDELEIVEDKRDTIEIDASEDESDKEDKEVSVQLSTKDNEIDAVQLSTIEDIQEPPHIENNETDSLVNRIHMKNPFVHIQYVNKVTENEAVTVQPTINVEQSPKEVTSEKINELIEIATSSSNSNSSKITLKPCVVKVERLEDSRDEAIIEMLNKVRQSGTTILRTLRRKSKRQQSLESENSDSDDDLIENSIPHSSGRKQCCGPKSSKNDGHNPNLVDDIPDLEKSTDIEESNDQNDIVEVIRSDKNTTRENETLFNVADDVPNKALDVEDIPEDSLTDGICEKLITADDAEKDEESNLDVVLKITKDKVNNTNSSTENESHAVTADSGNELYNTVISNDSVTDEEKLANVTVENLKEIDNTVSVDDKNKESEEDEASKNTKKIQHTESEKGTTSEKISLDAAGSTLNDLNKETTNESQKENNLVSNDSSEKTLENNKPIVIEEHIKDKNCVIMKDDEVSIILTDIFDTLKENPVSNKKSTVNIDNIENEHDQTNKKNSEKEDTTTIDIDENKDSSKHTIGSPEIVLNEDELDKTDVSILFDELKSLTDNANIS